MVKEPTLGIMKSCSFIIRLDIVTSCDW